MDIVFRCDPALFDLLKQHLDPNQPVATRSAAADVLSKAKLTPEQLIATRKADMVRMGKVIKEAGIRAE